MIHIGGKTFEVIKDHKDGFNLEAFRERYSEVLDRYDYIVGDWGYSQLRLKGFYKEGSQKANKDTMIASLDDYINEYCNFGCAYFIVEKIQGKDRDRQQERLSDQESEDDPQVTVDSEETPQAEQQSQTNSQTGKRHFYRNHAEKRKHPAR